MLQRVPSAPITSFLLVFAIAACGDDGGDGLGGADASGQNGELTDAGADASADADLDGAVDADAGADATVGIPDADATPSEDAGVPDADAAAPEDAGAFACAFPNVVTGVLGQSVDVALDTSSTDLRPRDLGLLCGNTDPAVRWAPQAIVQYEVPGTGGVAVFFTTRNSGTAANFDTVIQVRRDCASPPPFEDGRFPEPTCFEDSTANTSSPDFRSEGTVQATGGETLFFVVTGFSEGIVPGLDDRGPVTLRITPEANEPPTLTGAVPFVFGNDVYVRLSGTDPDDNVRGAIMNFRVNGAVLDIYGAGTNDPNISALIFDPAPGEVRNAIARPQIPLFLTAPPPSGVEGEWNLEDSRVNLTPTLGSFLASGIQQVGIRLYDTSYALSAEQVVNVVFNAQRVGYGEDCAADLCEQPYLCESNVCSATTVAQNACDPANVIDSGLVATSTAYASQQTTVRVPPGLGGFGTPSCVAAGNAAAREVVVGVSVPAAGRYDLLASTDTDVTGTLDTIISLRTTCLDPRTEVPDGCSDNISGSNRASAIAILDAAPGDYFLLVEPAGTSGSIQARDVGIDFELRPVVGAGAQCDPAGVTSRCDVGTCTADGNLFTCQ